MTFLFILLSLTNVGAEPAPPSQEALLDPFEGFDQVGMQPVLALFRADQKGRLLLQKARRKMKLRNDRQLIELMGFCSPADLQGQPMRRGLFIQETARYYRPHGQENWLTTTMGGLERLEDPDTFPVVDTKRFTTRMFEHMEVAFRPRICVREGLNVMQVYLVLYHELAHLVGLDPFDHLDLFSFTDHNLESNYYRKRLATEGGELDAYMAQIGAFRRLRARYDIPARLVMEDFLTEKGRLLVRERSAFMGHLLDRARYRDVLDRELQGQVVFQYNLAHSWWEAIEKVLTQLDGQHEVLVQQITETGNAQADAAEQGRRKQAEALRRRLVKLEAQLRDNRSLYSDYAAEQKQHVRFMERVDARFPRD